MANSTDDRVASRIPSSLPRGCGLVAALTAASIVATLLAPATALSWDDVRTAVLDQDLRGAFVRTLWTSLVSSAAAVLIAVPTAYAVSRSRIVRRWVEPLIDVPLAAPPVVIGVCLLLLFRGPLRGLDDATGISLDWPAVLIAQAVLAGCLATRLLVAVFDGISREIESVARSLGATPLAAFGYAVLPACWPGVGAAAMLAWARAFGEFGPVLVFAGVTRGRTEVLSTAIHLELSAGRVGVAAALSLFMLGIAAAVSVFVSRVIRPAHE